MLTFVLLFILLKASRNIEMFGDVTDSLTTLSSLPDYITQKITKSMDNLIAADSNSSADNNDTSDMVYLTTELLVDDPTIHDSNGEVDTSKYNQLVTEYIPLDALFNQIKQVYPDAYNTVFA